MLMDSLVAEIALERAKAKVERLKARHERALAAVN
jgi:hypothetical protein